jgi:hypothetical protein
MTRGARFRRLIAEGLAAAFLDGAWSPPEMTERGAVALGRSPSWLAATTRRIHAAFPVLPADRFGAVVRAIELDSGLEKALFDRREPLRIRRFFCPSPTMDLARADGGLPSLPTTGDIAAWLNEDIAHLAWLADWRGLARHIRGPRLCHYVYRWMPKRAGGLRLLEAPKPNLKAIQRRILHEILDRVPPHEAAHGFRHGRGILTHARAHAGKTALLRMDLEDFFISIPAGRVLGVFRTLGYPEEASRVLTGLCTSRAPAAEALEWPGPPTPSGRAALHRTRQRYRTRHLPQGAPTSPSLANLCAYGLDVRLAAAARRVGATYTRYADDLVFSGDAAFARTVHRFVTLVAAVALEEGFRVQHRKTRVMRRAQRQVVTGLVVNEHPAIRRVEFDRLRATLHNCARLGPESQNRDGHPDFRAHLEGAVAWVSHVQPERGAKLEAALRRIQWPAG